MNNNLIMTAALLLLVGLAYHLGLRRSHAIGAQGVTMHSRPVYHAARVALWCLAPALLVFIPWLIWGDALIRTFVLAALPHELTQLPAHELDNSLDRIAALAVGQGLPESSGDLLPLELIAAQHMSVLQSTARLSVLAAMSVAAIFGLSWSLRNITPQLRARNQIEKVVRALLVLSSMIAILTTIGIVLSMIGEALHFFYFVSPLDFFFGTVWDPRFSSVGGSGSEHGQFGLIPLLWGTLMVSIVALLVAIPTGLMTAIYMAEYASPRLRTFAKPVVEVLAGIPTIVYGFFALVVIGPFFHDLGAMIGLQVRATSALTAGVVMGVMIIPFVSSLSDDILTQVPRELREGSYGLGATRSETIMRVVLPAALPGIVGAFLLAASRAIGETMIVVLAAGNSPVLHANPLEAVSTVTVTIVNQLTGDLDFAGPQSLVAFALGITLFAITLALNVVALYIVRKYREQYE